MEISLKCGGAFIMSWSFGNGTGNLAKVDGRMDSIRNYCPITLNASRLLYVPKEEQPNLDHSMIFILLKVSKLLQCSKNKTS